MERFHHHHQAVVVCGSVVWSHRRGWCFVFPCLVRIFDSIAPLTARCCRCRRHFFFFRKSTRINKQSTVVTVVVVAVGWGGGTVLLSTSSSLSWWEILAIQNGAIFVLLEERYNNNEPSFREQRQDCRQRLVICISISRLSLDDGCSRGKEGRPSSSSSSHGGNTLVSP